jgi:hypothetical protein
MVQSLKMRAALLNVLGANVVLAAPAPAVVRKIGDAVQTTSGMVQGHEATWPEKSGVLEYLGIPFAKPPAGPLRWKKPIPFKGNGTLKGDTTDLQSVEAGAVF